MRKQRSKTRKPYEISPRKAHERAVEAWRTKHLRYRYKSSMLFRTMKAKDHGPDDAINPHDDHPDDEYAGLTEHSEEELIDEQLNPTDAEHEEEQPWARRDQTRRQRNKSNMERREKLLSKQKEIKKAIEDRQIVIHPPQVGDKIEIPLTRRTTEDALDDMGNSVQKPGDPITFKTATGSDVIGTSGKAVADFDTQEFVFNGTHFVSTVDPSRKILPHYVKEEEVPNILTGETELKNVVIVVPESTKIKPAPSTPDEVRQLRLKHLAEQHKETLEGPPKKEDKAAPLNDYIEAREGRRAEGYWRAQNEEVKEQIAAKRKRYKQGDVEQNFNWHSNYGGIGRPEGASGKGDLGLAPIHEKVYRSNQWELIEPTHENRYAQDALEFTLSRSPVRKERKVGKAGDLLDDPGKEGYDENDTIVVDEGEELKKLLSEHGLSGANVVPLGNNKFRITREQGQRINPAHADAIAYELNEKYGLAIDASTGDYDYQRLGPAMRQKRVVTSKYEAPPAWMDAEGQLVDRTQGKRIHTQLGERDQYGELKRNEADTISIRTKLPWQDEHQRLYLNLQERSDAIGWGTDWRPGEKEVGNVLLAGKRWNQTVDTVEAYEQAVKTGDDKPLEDLARELHPDADDEEIHHWTKELKEVGAAGAAAGVYSGRRAAKTEGVHAVVRKFPFHTYDRLQKYHILPTIEHAYVRPAGQKMDRALWRVRHPIRDPLSTTTNPLEYNITPELPSIRYRTRFVKLTDEAKAKNWTIQQQQREKRMDAQTKEVARARENISKAVKADPATMNRAQRLHRTATLRTAPGIMEKSKYIGFEERWERVIGQHDAPTQAEMRKMNVAVNEDELRGALRKGQMVEKNGTWVAKVAGPDGAYLKAAGKAGMYGVGAAAVVGAGVWAYDTHKKHQLNSGKESNTRLREHIPEVVKIPHADFYASKHKKLPENIWTDALDVGGKQVPVAWRVRNKPTKIRLRNHKDISGEGYKAAPLVGGVRGSGNKTNDGNWTNSIAYKQREEGAGRFMTKEDKKKNRYEMTVKGKKLPMNIEIGNKERWNDVPKGEKLRTNNPNKLKEEDRERIAVGIIKGDNKLRYEYGDDERIMQMINDSQERERLIAKHDRIYIDAGKPQILRPVQDPETGYWYYEPTATTRAGGKPISGPSGQPLGAWHRSPQEVESIRNEYYAEARRQQAINSDLFDQTIEQTRTGTFAAEGTKRTRPGGRSPVMGRDTLPGQLAEKRHEQEDKYERKRNDL